MTGRACRCHVDLRTLRQAGISVVELLQQTEILSHLDRHTLKVLARAFSFVGVNAGTEVMRQGDPGDGLYLVVSGRLQVKRLRADGSVAILGELSNGELLGEGSLMTSEPRYATVEAVIDTLLIRLPRADFQKLVERDPDRVRSLTDLIAKRQEAGHKERFRPVPRDLVAFLRTVPLFAALSKRQILDLEMHLRWLHLPGGKELMKQGEAPDGLYVVVGGRLNFEVLDGLGAPVRAGTFGRGDIIGELALVTGEPRTATVTALRDCELVKLNQASVSRLLHRSPRAILSLTRTIAERISGRRVSSSGSRFTSLAVIPVSPSVDTAAFTAALIRGLSGFGRVCHVNAGTVDRLLGPGSSGLESDHARSEELVAWLSAREEEHDYLVLEAGAGSAVWNERCIRGADRILLVADSRDDPKLSPTEVRFLGPHSALGAAREMVLLQRAGASVASGTDRFLERRNPERFHHIRAENDGDMQRLARCLVGRSVGLVLGGGGARGVAHIGVIQALKESGVPIDLVCGTSAGAIVGGLYALHTDTKLIEELVRRHLVNSNPLSDYTFPFVSLVRGRRYSQALRAGFGETRMEDLLIPFLAVACNLTLSEEAVFDTGPAWKAVRASTSLPGIVPPLYDGGQLFVDGGLLNNVPVDLMRASGAGRILAIEVSGGRANQDEDYGLLLGSQSGAQAPPFLQLLANRLRRREKRLRTPSLGSVLLRSTMLGSVMKVRRARTDADVYARLPMDRFGLLDWHATEELIQLGHEHALAHMAEWKEKLLGAQAV